MRVYLLLLNCVAFLQLKPELVHGAASEEEENNINPFELARQLRAEICAINKSRIQEFYKAQRDEENRDSQFPGTTTGQQIYNQRHPEISWGLRGVYNILVPYLGSRLENVTLDLFTWCVFPLSTTMEIYGCINSTDHWGSPGFRALGLLDIMSLKNVSRPAYKRGRLVIDTSENIYLSVLRGALVSCTIRLTDNSTIGVYYEMDLVQRSRGSTLIRISSQADAFLVEGQQKNFTCQSEGDEVFGYRWFHKTENGQYKYICEDVFTKVKETCNYTSFYQLIIREAETPGCEFEIVHSLRYQSINNVLFFVSPTVNDTGEMLCNSNSTAKGRGSSIYIAVVFTKLPPGTIDIKEGSSHLLTCEMKAPSDSKVYWTLEQVQNEECQIAIKNEASPKFNDTDSILPCNTTAVVSKTVKKVDKDYSIFHLELQIPEVNFKHVGTYTCNVKYKIGSLTEPQLIQQQSSISVIDQGKSTK